MNPHEGNKLVKIECFQRQCIADAFNEGGHVHVDASAGGEASLVCHPHAVTHRAIRT